MTSKNNPSHNNRLHLPNQQEMAQIQMQAAMQERNARDRAEQFLLNTLSRVYSGLVIEVWADDRSAGEPDYIKLVEIAQKAVEPLGIALGMLKPAPTSLPTDTPPLPSENAESAPVVPLIVPE